MAQGKKLQKIKFFAIARDIRDGRRNNQQMADFHGVSLETIRVVRVSKTWNGFQEYKKAKASSAIQRKIALGKERAAQPRTATPVKSDDHVLQAELDRINAKAVPSLPKGTDPIVMTRDMHNSIQAELASLHQRIDHVDTRVTSVVGKVSKLLQTPKKGLFPWSNR